MGLNCRSPIAAEVIATVMHDAVDVVADSESFNLTVLVPVKVVLRAYKKIIALRLEPTLRVCSLTRMNTNKR